MFSFKDLMLGRKDKSVAEILAFIWGGGGAGLRFSDKITSWIMSNFKETAYFDMNR